MPYGVVKTVWISTAKVRTLFCLAKRLCVFLGLGVRFDGGRQNGCGVWVWKLGAFDEKAPAFGGKRGAVGEKAGGYFFRMLVNCAISSFSFEISSSLG